jgi:uncharacterized protein YkwD
VPPNHFGPGAVKATPSTSDPSQVRVKFFRVVAVWLAAMTAFGGAAVLTASAAHADTGSEEAQFLALTNQLRSTLGIQQLTPNAQMTSIARQWSAQMAAAGTISHNPSLTSQAPSNWTRLGENVGMGGAVQAIQTAFINSPHHYENLANGAYNQVGVGVVDGANGTIFVTVDFLTAPIGGAASAPQAAAPRTTSPPRTTPATAPRTATPRPTSPPTTLPPSAPTPSSAPVSAPAAVKNSPAFPQVLELLRSVDTH